MNLEGMPEDERFRVLLARLDSVQAAVVRLARALDEP